MALNQGGGEDVALANRQSRAVVGVIIEFELVLRHD